MVPEWTKVQTVFFVYVGLFFVVHECGEVKHMVDESGSVYLFLFFCNKAGFLIKLLYRANY